MTGTKWFGFSLCVLCVVRGESLSAPPTVSSLFPAGGQRGTVVGVAATGTFDAWPSHVWSSDTGIQAVAEKEKGQFRVAVGPAVVPGVHWLRFYDSHGASALRPFVVGTLPEAQEKEQNDSATIFEFEPTNCDVVMNGKLAKTGDVDCFAVPLKKGTTLVAAVEAHSSLRSPIDAVLQIVSPAGAVLAQNHDHRGLDPLVAFTAPAAGTYIVRLFAFPATPDSSIRHFGSDTSVYRLTLTTGPYADGPNPLAASQEKPTLTLQGWNTPSTVRLSRAIDGYATAWHPAAANPVTVRAESHDCFDATLPGPLPLTGPPVSITARLARPNQAVIVPVALKKGVPLTVAVESASFGLPVVPVVRVLDPAGRQVARGEPKQLHEDTSFSFAAAADGTFGIEVRDLYGLAGGRHRFLVRVTPFEPEVKPTTPADRIALAPGKPLDVPIAFGIQALLAGDVAPIPEGFPPGVTARFVLPDKKSDAKDKKADGAAFTLRISAEPMTWSGPIRLGIPTKAGPVRYVRAPNADFDRPTADLWLTVITEATPAAQEKPKKR